MQIAKREAENRLSIRLQQVAEPEIWTERMLKALGDGVQGGKWYSLMDKVYPLKTLRKAWNQVRKNKGAAGIDGQSVSVFDRKSEDYLKELAQQLEEGKYKPQPVKRVLIPKEKGKRRPLGIPVVKDRIVQAALLMVLQPIFEREFLESSFGFRPKMGCKDALREVVRLLKDGWKWVVDLDLENYFETIPHKQLLERVGEHVSDGNVMGLVESFLNQEVVDDLKRWKPLSGTPQGAVLSPLLANIYLHPLDKLLKEKGIHSIRYADDAVLLCRTKEEAEEALLVVENWVRENGLKLNPDKTHLGNSDETGGGFEFLGYRFEQGKKWVRKKSLAALKNKIRERTKRTLGKSLADAIVSLNKILKGWFEYFKHAETYAFRMLDGFVRRRLRAMLRCQSKKTRGQGSTLRDHKEWPNAFFAKEGLFTMQEARLLAIQSRLGHH